MKKADGLPRDAQSILKLAAKSMFELFAGASQGMLLVDREARVVWINDQYRRFLPALGFEREEDFVGHPVAQVIQNTQMHQVLRTGKPILLDLLTNRAGTFVVNRIPLRDARGRVMGALGIVLLDHAETNLKPLMGKFEQLQRDLDDARRLPDGRVAPHYDPNMVQQFVHYPDDYLLWSHYDALDIPVLCLRGEASDLVLRETTVEMQQRGPGQRGKLQVVEIPGCGHAPALNVPEQLDRVEAFVASC